VLGLFNGLPGARAWRRRLSEAAHRPGAGTQLLLDAMDAVRVAASSRDNPSRAVAA
jgi:tRNA-dihydrouridine synthase A